MMSDVKMQFNFEHKILILIENLGKNCGTEGM